MQLAIVIRNNILDVSIYTRCSGLIGTTRSIVDRRSASLANIHVQEPFRRLGYGSIVLQETERSLVGLFDVSSVGVLAWQPCVGWDVIDFYKKNGYKTVDDRVGSFDDYSQLYDLVRMHKKALTKDPYTPIYNHAVLHSPYSVFSRLR